MKVRKEAHEAAAFTKFRLLMWKNFLQQWRHRIQTVVELLLPVMTMTLALILRWQIAPTPRDTLVYPSIPAHTLNYSTMVLAGMNITRMSIAYSPRSPELDDVLRSAVTNLLERNAMDLIPILEEYLPPELEIPPEININSTEIYEFVKSLISVNAYNNSSELRGIYALEETTRLVLAAVEFDDRLYGSTELPTNISYSLRFPERPRLYSFYSRGGRSWRTDYVFPSFETPGPRFPSSWEGGNNPGYVNEMFIALQHAISMELISRITGEDMKNFIVNIQRYPHPPFVQDVAVEAFQLLMPLFIVLSFSYTAVNIVRSVTLEKELQLKETMKIMGLPTWLHWTAWFCKQFIYLLVTSILIIIILKINWFTTEDGFSDYSVFTNTPWTVLLFFFVIYLTCIIFFCFMISSFFSKGSTAALFTGIAWFLSTAPAALITMEGEVSVGLQVFTCLGINTAMTFGVQLLYGRESTGGLQWGDFMSSPSTESSRFVFGHVVLMLVVDCVLYMLITLYFEQVLPGPFGTPKRWYFPFQKEFWFPSRENYADRVIFENDSTDDILKENDPTGHAIGVKMNNLTKIYGSNIVVNNLSLNIYDDQITVLLGHNGAGKSTTISMLTGNLEVSHGSVTVAGYDIGRQAGAARSHLGLCPQHNVLFNELTVREHLEFYARLKGYSGKELHEEIDSLMEKLELNEKRDSESQELSGGQKRRLSVGIALCGAARVVLLDEPTSGMDPASRRALWDLLQKEKKGRSMILTTHFMDEADILGDRIAILANGRLQCVGSPHFLKQNHGVGYSLVVVKDEGFDFDACSDLIDKYIPGAIKDDRGSEVRYVLTNDFSHIFEPMLCDLDNNIDTIKFKNYGLISTTLEDVFMSLGSDMALVDGVSVSDDGATTLDSASDDVLRQEFDSLEQLNKDEEKVTGVRLLCQHVLAVWLKLWLVWSRSWGLVLMQLTVPVILINLTLAVFSFVMSFVDGIQARNLTLTEGFARTETLLSYNGTSTTAFGSLAKAAYELIFDTNGIDTMTLTMVNNQPIVDHYLERAQDPVTLGIMRHSVLIGATFDEDSATAWFSNFGYHDVAVSLSAVHSALLKALNSTAQLNVYNYPLEVQYTQQNDMQTMVTLLSMQLSNGIGTSVAIVSAVFIMFYIKERVSGAKLLQQAAGLQPVLLWTSAAVFDWLWFITISLTVLASCFAFNVLGLSTPDELGRLYLCLIVYGAAMMPMNYLFSHFFRGPALGFVVMFFINVIFGMMGAQIVEALSAPQLDTAEAATVLDYILQCFPMYSFVTAVRLLNQIELTVMSCLQVCDYMTAVRPNITECTMHALCENDIVACCVRDNPHFDWEAPGILRYLLVMVIVCAVLWVVLLFVEYRLFHKIYKSKKTLPPVDMSSLDEDVADEARHVQRVPPARLADHGLVAKDLAKYYGKHLAVDQVSFTVNDSECFGLLGVNGAGKTTTFKMLMGDESISSGEAFVSGHSVQKDITKVHNNIGYCPQFDALFNEMTGRETLRVFSLLRGLRSDTAAVQAEALAHSLGFHKHFDKRVEQYSGGTKRKLNTAVSFLGRARMVFVDEPTTGVDPAAKRHVWRAIRGVQRAGRGVVLTSHSMEECEALCSRLTIMVNGRFQCLGTPQHLKNKFSQGFTLTIKIRAKDVSRRSSGASDLEAIKNYINSNFSNPKIMEEYQGVLTYYLPDRTMPWSRMFGVMERAKRDLQVEYYNISQTTLEQIFLQFTKYQRENLNIS